MTRARIWHAAQGSRVLSASLCLIFITILLIPLSSVSAATGLVAVNGAGGEISNAWTTPANARGVADNNTYATATPGAKQRITGSWNTYNFDSTLPLHAVITKVEIIAQYSLDLNLIDSRLEIQGVTNGTSCPATPFVDNSRPTSDTDVTVDITSCLGWTRDDLLNSKFSTKIAAFNNDLALTTDFSLDYIKVRVTYKTPDYDQVAYRWFDNSDSTGVGQPLTAQGSAPALYAPRDRVRLRLVLHVTTVPLLTSSEVFKLQFAQKNVTCAGSTFVDVTTTSAISYFNNPSVANGLLTTSVNDPTHGTDVIIPQSYSESASFSTLANVPVGQDGLWDVSLVGNGALANTAYCFRMVTNSDALLTTYSVYPEIVTSTAGELTVDFVDGSAVSVASPSFIFASIVSPADCSVTTATLGTASQKMRLKNTTDTQSWSVSLAATGGSTALWSSGTPKYDYNDPSGSPAGCSAGLDADTYAGQMTINPSVGTVTPRSVSACTNTGISKGASAAFNESSLNAISILTAASTANTGCYWDLTGVGVSQRIPGGQQPGSYSLSLTLTVLAN